MKIKDFLLLVIAMNNDSARSFQPQRLTRSSIDSDCVVSTTLSSKKMTQLDATKSIESIESHNHHRPWYSHPDIERDRSHVQKQYNNLSDVLNRYQKEQKQYQQNQIQEPNCNGGDDDGYDDDDDDRTIVDISNGSKFLLISSEGMWHQQISSSSSQSTTTAVALPLYLTATQLVEVVSSTSSIDNCNGGNVNNSNSNSNENDDNNDDYNHGEQTIAKDEPLIAYIGKYQDTDYWVVYLKDRGNNGDDDAFKESYHLKSVLTETFIQGNDAATATSTTNFSNGRLLECKPLREFGDSLEASYDAGILATANGLVEFHKSHGYCSYCGDPTKPSKAGGSRKCSNNNCRRSVYPRIDSATIMLVTSPCDKYALLGRKKSWPAGRFSTLAGFCEVGETLEECCQRETFEESGVVVDPVSVRFEASQPWPFPRSLMVGFRAKAISTVITTVGGSTLSSSESLPEIIVDTSEMEDIRWFSKEFVRERLSLGGSTALSFQPNDAEKEFHVPGKASLARYLITNWTDEII